MSSQELTENYNVRDMLNAFKSRYNIDNCAIDTNVLFSLPAIFTHGDLCTLNIIFDGTDYYIADFEHSGRRYFLYDFFMFIYSEYLLRGEARLMDMYFDGKFDVMLDEAFSCISGEYKTEDRITYFMAFLIEIYYERWQNNRSFRHKLRIRETIRRFCNI